FSRIQFTPDLMPADVTGASIYNQRESDFEFRPGPIFTHLLLADEINRAPPKTQAALLEAMQERQVTSEGTTRRLERPFIVLAARVARAAQALALPCGARRPRLRDARGREDGRRSRAGAPPHLAPRALGTAHLPGGRRPRAPRDRPDPGRGRPRAGARFLNGV